MGFFKCKYRLWFSESMLVIIIVCTFMFLNLKHEYTLIELKFVSVGAEEYEAVSFSFQWYKRAIPGSMIFAERLYKEFNFNRCVSLAPSQTGDV